MKKSFFIVLHVLILIMLLQGCIPQTESKLKPKFNKYETSTEVCSQFGELYYTPIACNDKFVCYINSNDELMQYDIETKNEHVLLKDTKDVKELKMSENYLFYRKYMEEASDIHDTIYGINLHTGEQENVLEVEVDDVYFIEGDEAVEYNTFLSQEELSWGHLICGENLYYDSTARDSIVIYNINTKEEKAIKLAEDTRYSNADNWEPPIFFEDKGEIFILYNCRLKKITRDKQLIELVEINKARVRMVGYKDYIFMRDDNLSLYDKLGNLKIDFSTLNIIDAWDAIQGPFIIGGLPYFRSKKALDKDSSYFESVGGGYYILDIERTIKEESTK